VLVVLAESSQQQNGKDKNTMKSLYALIMVVCFFSPAGAQQTQPDRKDYIISTIQSQRNDALDREAICRSDSTSAMDVLRKEIVDLKEKLASAEKK
jgi:hypothetical protein